MWIGAIGHHEYAHGPIVPDPGAGMTHQ
jgi:hypothetical protein